MSDANGTTAQHVEEKQEKAAAVITAQAPKAPLAFMPSSWDDAFRIAKYLSETGLTPDALRGKVYDLLYIIATGQEFGLNPIQSIREIVIVKGKPYLSALLRIGFVKTSPECEYFRLVESDNTKATFETKRRGEGITKLTYTIEDAKLAGLYGRKDKDGKLLDDNWNKSPGLMLRRRCGSQLADEVYPDKTRGSRDREELDEERERELNPPPLRGVGPTSAPPPPEEAQVVEPKASPPKERKLKVADMSEPTVTTQPGIHPGSTIISESVGGVDSTKMDFFEEVCIRLKECADVDQVDRLSMNTDQTKLTGDQRNILGQLLKSKRKALGGSGK